MFIGAHDFPYLFSEQAKTLLNIPYVWSPQSHDALGVFTLSTLWTWPYGILYGFLASLGLDFGISALLLGIIPTFLLGWVFSGKLIAEFTSGKFAKMVGQTLFVANTYILMLIDGGQLSIGLSYALLPGTIFYSKSPFKLALILTAISFLDIRFVYISLIAIGLKIVTQLESIVQQLISIAVSLVLIIGMHSYWIVPSIMSRGPVLPETYSRTSQVEALSFSTLSHTITLTHPHWPKNIFGQISEPLAVHMIIPILCFMSLILLPGSRKTLFMVSLAMVGIFLSKGSNPPDGWIFKQLFENVPGFSLFRDPTKFYPLICIAYSVLLAAVAEKCQKFFRPMPLLLIGLIITTFIKGHQSGFTGLLSSARNQSSYLEISKYISSLNQEGGVLWVPKKPPLGYSSPSNPSTDALSLVTKRSFSTGIVGSYETLNFLRDATQSGELLGLASIRFVAFSSPDELRDSRKPEDLDYRLKFKNLVARSEWVESEKEIGGVSLLTNSKYRPIVSMYKDIKFVLGAEDYLTENGVSDSAIVFVESEAGLSNRYSEFPNSSFDLNGKSVVDLAASMFESNQHNFPAKGLDFSPNSRSSWWKRESSDVVGWRAFLQEKYSLDNQDFDYRGGWAVSETTQPLKITLSTTCDKDCILLIRAMSSERGGKILIKNGDAKETVGEIITKNVEKKVSTQHQRLPDNQGEKVFVYSLGEVAWHSIPLTGPVENSITLIGEGDINVINSIILTSASDLENKLNQAKTLLERKSSQSANFGDISYKKINPTKYQIMVANQSGPVIVSLSQNYDPYWRTDTQRSVPLFGMINGFLVDGSGEFTIEYYPQRYVIPGLLVSFASGILFIFAWIKSIRS